MRHLTLVLSAFLALHAIFASSYFGNFSKIFAASELGYEQKRILFGFNGVPVDQIADALDALFPIDAPIALSPDLAREDFLKQRFTEALYPRLIDRAAPQAITMAREQDFRSELGPELGRIPGRAVFFLKGATPPVRSASLIARRANAAYSWARFGLSFGLALLSALGFGVLVTRLILNGTRLEPELIFPAAVLSGAVVVAFAVTAATWLQFAVHWQALLCVGVLANLGGYPLWKRLFSGIRAVFRRPESVAFAALLITFFVRVAVFPLVMWDGRSVWLFNAKKIFVHGMMSHADARHADMLWSHPDYPLLFTSWMAFFSALGGSFNERLASLGIPVMLAGALSLFWVLARRTFGRWPGALLTLWLFLMSENLAGGAYVDEFILISSAIGLLALLGGTSERVGYLALMIASLIKVEGLVLAFLIACAHAALSTAWKKKPLKAKARSLLWLVPALSHRIYIKLAGIQSSDPFDLEQFFSEFFSRLGDALAAIPGMLAEPGYTNTRFAIWDGILCALVSLAVLVWCHRRRDRILNLRSALGALTPAAAFAAIALLVILAVPHDVTWLVQVTLDRLLLHPAALAVLAPFLLLSEKQNPYSRT